MKKFLISALVVLILVVVYFQLPKVNFVISGVEEPIYGSLYPKLYKGKLVSTTIYPNVVSADTYLYTKPSALQSIENNDEIPKGSIVFNANGEMDGFDIAYGTDYQDKYSDVYDLDSIAVVYSGDDYSLLATIPANIPSFTYSDVVTKVGAKDLAKSLESFEYVLIYEVEDCLELIYLIEDKVIVPYVSDFESFTPAAYVELDKSKLLEKKNSGYYKTPHRLVFNTK